MDEPGVIPQLLAAGPQKYAYDLALVCFLAFRFFPFVHNFRNVILRNIYLAILFSTLYATSLGIFVDLWIDEYDSELRIIFGLIGAYFVLKTAISLWAEFGTSKLLPLSSRSIEGIAILLLTLSSFSLVFLEYFYGRPEVFELHTESFDIRGNLFLGTGRIFTRLYIIMSCLVFCIILVRLAQTAFVNDSRLRLRAWAAATTIALVAVHYINISIGTTVVIMYPVLEDLVHSIYERIAIIVVVLSIISIVILACARFLLDCYIRFQYHLHSAIRVRHIESLQTQLTEVLTHNSPETFLASSTQPLSSRSRSERLSHGTIAVIDLRRLALCYLTDDDVNQVINQSSVQGARSNDITLAVSIEATLLDLAMHKIRANHKPTRELSSRIPEPQVFSLEELAAFYADVTIVLKRISRDRTDRPVSQRVTSGYS